MKIKVKQKDFFNAVKLVEKVTGKNLTLPVLNCILLSSKGNLLTLRATNLEVGIEISIPTSTDQEGIIAVPGYILSGALLGIQNNETLTLEVKKENLQLTTGKNISLIKAYPHDDFPTLPQVTDSKTITIPTQHFVNGLRSVWYSASTSTIKPELASIYIYTEGQHIMFVATDSFRLAEKKLPLKESVSIESLLIPLRSISDIIRVLEQAPETISLQFNNNQLTLTFNGLYLTSRLVDSTFPDYKQIIPKEFTTEATVLREEALQALKKTALFSDKYNKIHISLKPKNNIFSISSQNTDIGETEEKIPAKIYGDSLDINFNYKYITDCFQSLHTDNTTFSFSGLSKPMVIKNSSDASFFYLIMPTNR